MQRLGKSANSSELSGWVSRNHKDPGRVEEGGRKKHGQNAVA
jgi:hypothetical protein